MNFSDYGVKDSDIPWLKDDAEAIGTTLQQLESKSSKTTTKRPIQDCPVPGCQDVCLSKLPCHLRITHRFSVKERRKYLALAKKVNIYLSWLYCTLIMINACTFRSD